MAGAAGSGVVGAGDLRTCRKQRSGQQAAGVTQRSRQREDEAWAEGGVRGEWRGGRRGGPGGW